MVGMNKTQQIQHNGREMTEYNFEVQDFISTADCDKIVAAHNWEWIFCREAAPFITVRTTNLEMTREVVGSIIVSALA